MIVCTIPSREKRSSAQNSTISNLRRFASSNSRANWARRPGSFRPDSCSTYSPAPSCPARCAPSRSHIWDRETNDHYVEPAWCSERLFDVEEFYGRINDPCCGFGTIPEAAYRAGIGATACDLVDRGYKGGWVEDFFTSTWPRDNIVSNPPFNIVPQFVRHALEVTGLKVCILFPTARLNAAN